MLTPVVFFAAVTVLVLIYSTSTIFRFSDTKNKGLCSSAEFRNVTGTSGVAYAKGSNLWGFAQTLIFESLIN